MPNTIDIYQPRYLAEVVRSAPPVHTFLRDTFFTNVKTFTTEEVDIDIVKGDREMRRLSTRRLARRRWQKRATKPRAISRPWSTRTL